MYGIIDNWKSALYYTTHSYWDNVEPQMLSYDKAVAYWDENVKGSSKELMI